MKIAKTLKGASGDGEQETVPIKKKKKKRQFPGRLSAASIDTQPPATGFGVNQPLPTTSGFLFAIPRSFLGQATPSGFLT